MAKSIVLQATVTGADDSVSPEELLIVAEKYHFAEFGILLSKNLEGRPRFPSRAWIKELYKLQETKPLNLSAHICGDWVRQLCAGDVSFFLDFHKLWPMFNRFQFNFHAEKIAVEYDKFLEGVEEYLARKQIIFQLDGVNEGIFRQMAERSSLPIFPLFDRSGGKGLLPGQWPKQITGFYCGYAGGLSPKNLAGEMERISQIAQGPIWIDAETFLRTNDNKKFLWSAVYDFLDEAIPWISHW
jgi:hypothetical protein